MNERKVFVSFDYDNGTDCSVVLIVDKIFLRSEI